MAVNYSKYGTSYNEQLIYLVLKHFYSDTINRCVVLKDKIYKGIEFDIAIPSLRLCIEYSPTSTHKGHYGNGGQRDSLKRELCKVNNVRFIEIIEDTFNEMEHYCTKDIYCFCDRLRGSISIYDILDSILKDLGHSIDELNLENIRNEAYKRSNSRCIPEKSIKTLCKEMEIEWNEPGINTNEISPYSHMLIHWKCTKCGYGNNGEWYVRPVDRMNYKSGCPSCGYNIFTSTFVKQYNNVVYNCNDLLSQYKELVELEWDFDRNTKDPNNIKATTHIKCYWHCEKCGYGNNGEWFTTAKNRVEQKQGCPNCGWNIFKHGYNNINKNRHMVKNLANTYPELAKELNTELTGKTANEIAPGYSQKVFWTCIKCGYGKNGEWQVKPNSRTYNKNGCPRCKENWFRRETK